MSKLCRHVIFFVLLFFVTSCLSKDKDHATDLKRWAAQDVPELGKVDLSSRWNDHLDFLITVTPAKKIPPEFEDCEKVYLNFFDGKGRKRFTSEIPLETFSVVHRDKNKTLTKNDSIECTRETYKEIQSWTAEYPCVHGCDPKPRH